MPRYRYQCFDVTGGKVSGTIESETVEKALIELRHRGWLPSSIEMVGNDLDWRAFLGIEEQKVGLADLEFFTAELSLLLESGVRIDRAIEILQRAGKSGAVGQLLRELGDELKKGKQLSEAAAARPDVFDRLYVNLVSLGEAGGRLPEVFRGLAEDLKFQRDLRQKVISAATYPVVVASVCILAILFIFNFVVPNLETLFADSTDLPWYTAMLLGASAFMRQWQWWVFAALAVTTLLIWRSRHSPAVTDF